MKFDIKLFLFVYMCCFPLFLIPLPDEELMDFNSEYYLSLIFENLTIIQIC